MLLARPFHSQGGHAYSGDLSPKVSARAKSGGLFLLLEDGKPLGPGNTLHDEIRHQGEGRFSLRDDDVFFSASDNTDCNSNGREYSVVALLPSDRAYQDIIARSTRDIPTLLTPPFTTQGGFGYWASLSPTVAAVAASGGFVLLFEDGKPLGPSNALHDDVRLKGAGRYNVQSGEVVFSASDNSDCNSNGRVYSVAAIPFSTDDITFKDIFSRFSLDAPTLLKAIKNNYNINNGFVNNYFQYYSALTNTYARHGIAVPRSMLEIGCGSKPYVALRFLQQGVTRYVAVDTGPIETTFDPAFLKDIDWLGHIGVTSPQLALQSLADDSGTIKALIALGNTRFEEIDIEGEFDLIFSVSVLEHVTDPKRVVEQMAALLKPGGYAWHSIDLRDHENFDDPLRFLTLTEEEYAPRASENRLRASDWLTLFSREGFRLVEQRLYGFRSATDRTLVEMAASGEPWVDEGMRSTFTEPFDAKSLMDLSTISLLVFYHKPRPA